MLSKQKLFERGGRRHRGLDSLYLSCHMVLKAFQDLEPCVDQDYDRLKEEILSLAKHLINCSLQNGLNSLSQMNCMS